jgi:archaetidylinositol phosphate synthase
MLKSHLRQESTDRLLSPLSRLGLHPNSWSGLSLILAALGFTFLFMHSLALGIIFFALSGFMDAIDGAVARATNSASSRGAFIDGILDRYVEGLLYLGIMFYLGDMTILGLTIPIWTFVLLFGALMTSFVRAYADHRGLVKDPALQKRMGGLMERAERLLIIYAGMVLGLLNPEWLGWTVVLVALLSNITVLQRLAFALRRG